MKNSSKAKKFYFVSIISLGIVYVLFLSIFFVQIVQSCFTNLLIYFGNDIDWSKFILSKDFLINIFGIIFFTSLFLKLIFGIIFNIYWIYITNSEISKLKFKEKKQIRFLEKQGLVFTAGFINPKIYVSKDLKNKLTAKEYKAVIEHEQKHKSDFDPLKKLIVKIVKDIIPPLPFKNDMFDHYNLITELSADEHAFFSSSKESIANALVKIINSKNSLYISSFNEQKERINILTGTNIFSYKKIFYMLIFLFVITIYPSVFLATQNYFKECTNLKTCYSKYLLSNENSFCYIDLNSINHFKLESKVLNYSENINYSKI